MSSHPRTVFALVATLPVLLTIAAVYVAGWAAASTGAPAVLIGAAGVAQLAGIVLPLALGLAYKDHIDEIFPWPVIILVLGAVAINGFIAGSIISATRAASGAWCPFAAYVAWGVAAAVIHRALDVDDLSELIDELR